MVIAFSVENYGHTLDLFKKELENRQLIKLHIIPLRSLASDMLSVEVLFVLSNHQT